MVQKDYILRMIEMMGLMVRRIKELIGQGQTGAAADELDAAAARTGIDLALARSLDGDSLLGLFLPAGSGVDPTNTMLLGEILYLDGLRLRADGRLEESHDCLAKSLLLHQAAAAHGTSIGVRFPEIEERLDELRVLLETG